MLLIACANVGNLLFTRALEPPQGDRDPRRRSAPAARRVFQQLLIEALVLALAGGAAGLLLAHAASPRRPRCSPTRCPAPTRSRSTAACCCSRSARRSSPASSPARARAARRTHRSQRRPEGRRTRRRRGGRPARGALLVVCEVALSVVLLMGAGGDAPQPARAADVDAGFDPAQRPDDERQPAGDALPDAGAALGVLRRGARSGSARCPASRRPARSTTCRSSAARSSRSSSRATPSCCRASSRPCRCGSHAGLSADDGHPAAARPRRRRRRRRRDARQPRRPRSCCGADDDPIGRRVTLPLIARRCSRQVVGIVGDVKQDEPGGARRRRRSTTTRASVTGAGDVRRSARRCRPRRWRRPAVGVIRALDPEQPVENIRTMDEVRDETLGVAALQRAAARPVRGGRAGARHRRHLQRAVLHRARPQPRDRHPDRARRAARRRAARW